MLGIIGCGNMGGAVIKGLRQRYAGLKLCVYDKDGRKLSNVRTLYKVRTSKNLEGLVRCCKSLVIAVKPQDMASVLSVIKSNYSGQLIISIAAGISAAFIEKKVRPHKARVIRVMPNLAATISVSASALCKGRYATNADMKKARQIFSSVGICVTVTEKYMDAVTAVSGSGPGYLYYFMEALEAGGRRLGLSAGLSRTLVAQTILGAAMLVKCSKEDFKALAKRVASKGGTTEAAFKVFDRRKLETIIKEATKAAYLRARALGK
jgi:pyrroline-5-carboxylate reductase